MSNRVVNLWNNLPQKVVSAETMDTFKNEVDFLWKDVKYTTNIGID